jgi:hypothetical protein
MDDKKKYTFELEASPYSWLLYAQELYEVANLIAKNSSTEINHFPTLDSGKTLQNAFYLNFGYSIENLLKGILIAEDSKKINNFKIDGSISANHDLLNLVKEIKSISFDKQEKKLLRILSQAIPNWGRYPVPKSYEKIQKKFDTSELNKSCLKKLWDKLIRHLYESIKDGDWTSPSGIKIGPFRDSTLETDMEASVNKLNERINKGEVLNIGNIDWHKTIYF